VKAQNLVIENDVHMVMFLRRQIGRHQPQASGHAEVNEEMAVFEFEQQILAAPVDGGEPLPSQAAAEPCRQRITQCRHAGLDSTDATADKLRGQSESRHLNFGQFGHVDRCLSKTKLLTSLGYCM
jgi:hypothetical protein